MASDRDERSPRAPLRYRDAGVDIDRQDDALSRIKRVLQSTRTAGVLSELGSFGGLFAMDSSAEARPVLVATCDGVGTKLRVAFQTGVHDTIGRDLVNHCVNDVLVQGGRPLFFLDYVATGRLDPSVLEAVVSGIGRGCRENGAALLGGETAEMPGFYGEDEYDLAGFLVGVVDRTRLIDGSRIRPGDVLVGLPSAGLHTNGYSLARKIFFEVAGLSVHDRVEELGRTVGEALLAEHRSYLGALARPVEERWLHGLAHITGGGLPDNLPRVLPEGSAARIQRGSWPVPEIFSWMQRTGGVEVPEMDRTFNMGIGMVAVLDAAQVGAFEQHLDGLGEGHFRIGEIVAGERGVLFV